MLVCCRKDQQLTEPQRENLESEICNNGQGKCSHPSLCNSEDPEIWKNDCKDPSSICCPILPSTELVPPLEAPKCGFRNVGGVKFGISGDKNGEAQYGIEFICFFFLYKHVKFVCKTTYIGSRKT